MAKPRVFVSSTYFDLKHIRASLEIFIESLGYEAILSEKGDIAYSPDQPLDESCYREARNADIFVLLVGGRYGAGASSGTQKRTKEFYDRYDSITKQEYLNAVSQDIPIYVLVEKGVYADYETYLRNKDNKDISYAHVDSVNIFRLIEFILSRPRNNPVFHFDRFSDIESWLREQWAGLFKEFIHRMSQQSQISSLSSQVTELAEVNKTLKRYLEEVVSKISPDSSAKLIEAETDRLAEFRKKSEIRENPLIKELHGVFGVPLEKLYAALVEAKTPREFVERVSAEVDTEKSPTTLSTDDIDWKWVTARLNEARASINLPSLDSRTPRGERKKKRNS